MTQTAKLNAFPVFMRVEGRVVVIVGGGEEALAKARLLGQSSAIVKSSSRDASSRPAPAGSPSNGAAHDRGGLRSGPSRRSAVMVFAASGDEALDRRVSDDARRLGIPVNAVDRPELCDFFTPAIVNRAPVCVAIGTEGAAPVLAQIDPREGSTSCCRRRSARWRRSPLRCATLPSGCCRKAGCAAAFWDDFFGGAPARAMEVGHAGEALRGRRRAAAAATRRAPAMSRWSAPARARKTC